jgi:cytochrome c biogenesis factor
MAKKLVLLLLVIVLLLVAVVLIRTFTFKSIYSKAFVLKPFLFRIAPGQTVMLF